MKYHYLQEENIWYLWETLFRWSPWHKRVRIIFETRRKPTGNETKILRRFCYSCFALLWAGIHYHEGYIANQFLGEKPSARVGKLGGVGSLAWARKLCKKKKRTHIKCKLWTETGRVTNDGQSGEVRQKQERRRNRGLSHTGRTGQQNEQETSVQGHTTLACGWCKKGGVVRLGGCRNGGVAGVSQSEVAVKRAEWESRIANGW